VRPRALCGEQLVPQLVPLALERLGARVCLVELLRVLGDGRLEPGQLLILCRGGGGRLRGRVAAPLAAQREIVMARLHGGEELVSLLADRLRLRGSLEQLSLQRTHLTLGTGRLHRGTGEGCGGGVGGVWGWGGGVAGGQRGG
jgi:hypothetical protein